MPEPRKRHKLALNFEVSPELHAEFKAFIAQRGTSQTDELTHALRRHLAFPPPLPEVVPYVEPAPKRPRGRPRKLG